MGTKQPKQAVVDCRHRLPARGRKAEQFINLAHGLYSGRLWSHTSSGYARFGGGNLAFRLRPYLYDPVVLARWARRLSWKETAEAFRTSWDKVFDAVEHVVTWGLEHRTLGQIDAIGVDEIQYSKGHKYPERVKKLPTAGVLTLIISSLLI
jgi:hypothetical protein